MKKPWLFRPFEYWPDWTMEIPYHLFVFFWGVVRFTPPKSFIRANYQLPYGGLHCASKYEIQENMGATIFPRTVFIAATESDEIKETKLIKALKEFGAPVIIKPDQGMTGRGMAKIQKQDDIEKVLPLLKYDYLAQQFVPGTVEYGVFWERHKGTAIISGINEKHYPEVIGNGKLSILELARKHERYTDKWESFLSEISDEERVLDTGEIKILSVIGSHTMGCKFTDETHLKTKALLSTLESLLQDCPGYNYGRLDVKSVSVATFERGELGVIEANGVESMATHIYDPKYDWCRAMFIVWGHARRWSAIARENRKQKMELPSLWKIIRLNIQTMHEMKEQQTRAEEIGS